MSETDRPEPAEAILELILRLEKEASKARRRLGESLRRLGIDPKMTMAQLGERLRALGAEPPPLIERPDYEVRVIPPVGPPGVLHVWVKAGLAHHHGDEHVLMVPLEAETLDEEAEAAAAATIGFYRAVYACPQCGERVTVALLHEQRPREREARNPDAEPAANVQATAGVSRASVALPPLGAPLAKRAKSRARRGRPGPRPR